MTGFTPLGALLLTQQLRQLGDVGGDAPGFVFGQQFRRIAALNWLVCG
jgi:hypothetical protein